MFFCAIDVNDESHLYCCGVDYLDVLLCVVGGRR